MEQGLWNNARSDLEAVLSSDGIALSIESQALSNLAVIEARERPERARELLERDLVIHGRLNDEFGRATTLINLALVELQVGDRSKAVVLLSSARESAQRVNAAEYVSKCARLLQDLEQL
jgi:hypothetical protein